MRSIPKAVPSVKIPASPTPQPTRPSAEPCTHPLQCAEQIRHKHLAQIIEILNACDTETAMALAGLHDAEYASVERTAARWRMKRDVNRVFRRVLESNAERSAA